MTTNGTITHTSWISTNDTGPKTVSSDITNAKASTRRIKRNMANQATTKVPEGQHHLLKPNLNRLFKI
ncbi:hypothetical protein CROQUDRAFT_87427 [Cronartium quercuum f. sp. fusiforme G11]|uniref:Uncharacterized protein n=1 Tax=Cronartium quercuum f. sp. fusiforme G11 TaxID=708437 RepID=A0A9P6TG11_9BASI|nr:hypothetical protein CROQUDRAFT_87427 [Cronartium quercuum f. sp. fusiforme G11]